MAIIIMIRITIQTVARTALCMCRIFAEAMQKRCDNTHKVPSDNRAEPYATSLCRSAHSTVCECARIVFGLLSKMISCLLWHQRRHRGCCAIALHSKNGEKSEKYHLQVRARNTRLDYETDKHTLRAIDTHTHTHSYGVHVFLFSYDSWLALLGGGGGCCHHHNNAQCTRVKWNFLHIHELPYIDGAAIHARAMCLFLFVCFTRIRTYYIVHM